MSALENILVVVPSYNHGRFIKDRIDSIISQSFGNLNIYVIDDCSTDETHQVLSAYDDPRITVIPREINTGSPFSAWIDAAKIIEDNGFKYIWIAESDDKADLNFAERAVSALRSKPEAAFYYCHSWYIDEDDMIIGHSINYLNKYFCNQRWDQDFIVTGKNFIQNCLIRGMAIPNMSSVLMRSDNFLLALRKYYSRYKLAADWIFAGNLAATGDVIFESWDGNYFRHHKRTSRSETQNARMVFEHYSATRSIFKTGHIESGIYSDNMKIISGMFIHDRTSLTEFVRYGIKISPVDLCASLWHLGRRKWKKAQR